MKRLTLLLLSLALVCVAGVGDQPNALLAYSYASELFDLECGWGKVSERTDEEIADLVPLTSELLDRLGAEVIRWLSEVEEGALGVHPESSAATSTRGTLNLIARNIEKTIDDLATENYERAANFLSSLRGATESLAKGYAEYDY
ncbi:hypothetical protein K8R78_02015 [bacterium]|nr:hypothetical protein [bacterium]